MMMNQLNSPVLCMRFVFLLLFLGMLSPVAIHAQQQNVSGNVKEPNGKPLSEVSVRVKGTTRGTSTNASGNFTLQANKGETLLFSYLGYLGKEVVLSNQQVLNVVLSP